MNKRLFIVAMLGMICGVACAQPRFGGALESAVKRGVTKAVTKKAESIAEKKTEAFLNRKLAAWESSVNAELKASQQALAMAQDSMRQLMDVPFDAEYSFTTIVKTVTKVTEKNGETTSSDVVIYMNPQRSDCYAYGIGDLITLMDYKNKVQVLFSANDTNKVYVSYQISGSMPNGTSNDSYTKIGTKDICGYTCQGYSVKNGYYSGESWVAESSDFVNCYTNATNLYMPTAGFPMLAKGVLNNGENKLDYISEVTEVKKNQTFIIKKSDYKSAFEE
ncbi:MAG: hypothetical protein MJ069_07315 [Salinivirgaceae bacterium]|nr:hypothetical protein [Salinivirgaceae bacterium]